MISKYQVRQKLYGVPDHQFRTQSRISNRGVITVLSAVEVLLAVQSTAEAPFNYLPANIGQGNCLRKPCGVRVCGSETGMTARHSLISKGRKNTAILSSLGERNSSQQADRITPAPKQGMLDLQSPHGYLNRKAKHFPSALMQGGFASQPFPSRKPVA